MSVSRRSFLNQAAASSIAFPFLLPSHVWAAETKPNSRLTMGFVGMGMQNRGLLGGFLGHDTEVLAVCDVDTTRRDDAKQRVEEYYAKQPGRSGQCAAYNDFREMMERKDIDAISIATPDHWHTIIAVAALRAGKDVYCEKPLTHNIHESIVLLREVDANRRVLQTGSMQRSSKEFRVACELVLNGAIGQVQRVECSFGGPPVPYNLPEEPTEPGLDWNLWVGPAPMKPYNSAVCPRGVHNRYPSWRSYQEFGSGGVGDWGAHHLDIAQWGLGMDDSGPVEILPPEKPNATQGVKFIYANGVVLEHKSGFGVHFFGTEGEVQVNRGLFTFKRGTEMVASHANRDDRRTSCAGVPERSEDPTLREQEPPE